MIESDSSLMLKNNKWQIAQEDDKKKLIINIHMSCGGGCTITLDGLAELVDNYMIKKGKDNG